MEPRDTAVTTRRPSASRQSASRRQPKNPRPSLHVVPPRDIEPTDLKNPALYINRELSWLAFNERVLEQARDAAHPLLERVKFLGITGRNLDEFYMIRVATTLKKLQEGIEDIAPDGYNTEQQLDAMRAGGMRLLQAQAGVWEELRRELTSQRISFLEVDQWTSAIREHLSSYFSREICPVLTPLAFDPGHPFPLVSNLSKNFAVVVRHGGRTKFARVKVPDVLPRFVPLPESLLPSGSQAYVFLEDIIRANMQELFPGTQLKSAHLFRIIRDADLEFDQEEADDLLETVDRGLKQLRHGAISLLQVEADMPQRILAILVENFEIGDDAVVVRTADRMAMGDWLQLHALHRPELKYAPYTPHRLWRADADAEEIFDEIRFEDILVHHPYDSFASVEAFVRVAVRDPHVVAIKMTLYRIGQNSPLIPLLIEAAEGGKQVAVLVELKARFEERNNILWARALESHGIHVVYGFPDLKVHAKLCLVVRQEQGGIQRYVHTGTGNYNPETARMYTDLGLFTADPDIIADVSEIFNYLTGYSNQKDYRGLLVAPVQLRSRLTELIMREAEHAQAGRAARMIIKINAITDDQMIRVLYRASQAGVSIDLICRGICSLRPGIPGISDNIRVRSIVGRFLEHSRIFWFENGGQQEMYIGSADLMERNLDRRVESLIPVRDQEILEHLRGVVLQTYLEDTDRAMVLDSAGHYERLAPGSGPFNAQQSLIQHYTERHD